MAVKTGPPAKPEFSGDPDEKTDGQAPTNTPDAKPEPDFDDFTYVKFPDGHIRAVPNDQIMRSGQNGGLQNLEGPAPGRDESEVYLHLADGSVEKVKAYDVPPAAGTNYPNGFFVRDGKAYLVVGVYPAETDHA